MKVIRTHKELDDVLNPCREQSNTIGFVPTMGALHEGHATLVTKCVRENDICVVSVFVNPTQFNNKEDLLLYPRTLDADCKLLEGLNVDYVFAPCVEEMYPGEENRQFDFDGLDKVMEGKFRPGHFNGVAQIVSKLFYAVKPSRSYFGEKDFQQLAIIRNMVKKLAISVEIIPVPIVREESGLARSSRNERLTETQRKDAANINRVLQESKIFVNEGTISECVDFVTAEINKVDSLEVEYMEIVDGNTLQSVSDWNNADYIVGCVAVFCGEVRLIDNIQYK